MSAKNSSYVPELMVPADAKTRAKFVRVKKQALFVVDDLFSQCEELYKIRNPRTVISGVDRSEVRQFVRSLTGSLKIPDTYGTWAWYPWSRTLVHFLPEALHTELRTARNRNLITQEKQKQFYQSRIGIAGLSVGNAVVASIIHTGGAKYLSIADKDILSGSNTNRIRCGFDSLGLSKIAIIAREVYALNPYASISAFPDGLTKEIIQKFLTVPKPLQLIIDEMDDLYLKIQLRVAARNMGIPVIMAADNGDGIVVDIERFDVRKDTPLMHGDIPENTLLAITPDVSRPVAARIISSWVRPENIDDRMKRSLMELGKTLYTWPQLGNAAFMAGAVLSYVARSILVGDPIRSGKFVVNPEVLFVPGFTSKQAIAKRKRLTQQFSQAVGL